MSSQGVTQAQDAPSNANQGCVGPRADTAGKASACEGCPNQKACSSGAFKGPTKEQKDVKARLADVKHVVLILSGKGGVGKSTISSQLAWSLQDKGYQVGVLDIDICGPSMPRMLGVEGQQVRRSNFGWSPVYATENLGVMSVGFMLPNKTDAVVWRGPRKDALIKQFLMDVNWGELDFLLIDAPPGTSDEHISVTEYLRETEIDGAVIVTTPQEVSLLDVRKEITFCRKTETQVLGVVENMGGFICPCCNTRTEIFPSTTGGGAGLAAEMKVPFLASIPLDGKLVQSCERGVSYLSSHPNSTAAPALTQFVDAVLTKVRAEPPVTDDDDTNTQEMATKTPDNTEAS